MNGDNWERKKVNAGVNWERKKVNEFNWERKKVNGSLIRGKNSTEERSKGGWEKRLFQNHK